MDNRMPGTGPGEVCVRTHPRRAFLKKAAVAGVTVAYAAPLIESLTVQSVSASVSAPPGGTPPPGNSNYIYAVTKGGFNLPNSNQPCALYAVLGEARTLYPSLDSVVGTTNNPNGTCGTTDVGALTVLGCSTAPQTGPDLVDFLGITSSGLKCNDSCGIEDLTALALMVAANALYPSVVLCNANSTPCTAIIGLGQHACVDVSSLGLADRTTLGGGTTPTNTASVDAVLKLAIGQAPTTSSSGTLCGNTALVNLIQAMAQDISNAAGLKAPYLSGSC